jgi:hypothetical protein
MTLVREVGQTIVFRGLPAKSLVPEWFRASGE